LELVGIELAVEVGDVLLHPGLRVDDGAIMDGGADLFQEEVEQQTGGEIAEGLRHIFCEVAFDGSDGVRTGLVGKFDVITAILRAEITAGAGRTVKVRRSVVLGGVGDSFEILAGHTSSGKSLHRTSTARTVG
jgi:hypothetical protein